MAPAWPESRPTALTPSDPSSGAQAHAIPARRDIGGIGVAVLDRAEALSRLGAAFAGRNHVKLAFCNANLVNLAADDPLLRQALREFLVLADGIGVDLASRLLYGVPFPANLNGTDFIPALLAAQSRPLDVALIGGRPGVAERAAECFAQLHPRHRFTVLSHGYFAPAEEAALLDRLLEAPPDLLLVAFGNPLQERWIAEKITGRHALVAAGIGALFDFLAGEIERAPATIRQLRLEWAYRLAREPARLWRRYLLGNPLFLLRVLRNLLSAERSSS